MRRITLAVLFAVLPLGAQQYYLAGAGHGYTVGLSLAPRERPVRTIRLPIPVPPTPKAEAEAKGEPEGVRSRPILVALAHIPEESGGYSDLWVLAREDGWRPTTRLTIGGMLMNAGLVRAPLNQGPLQEVYDQAFVNAVANNTGWFARIGVAGENAWIAGKERMAMMFQLRMDLANQASAQRRKAEEDEERNFKRGLKGLPYDQQVEAVNRRLAKRGMVFDPKRMRVHPIGEEED